MLDKAMDTAVGALDRRFLLTAFLPTAVFLALVAFTVWPSSGHAGVFAQWQRQSGGQRLAEGIAFLAVAMLSAALLGSMTGLLLKVYEGYWPGRIGEFGRRHHRAVLVDLSRRAVTDPRAYSRIEAGYPLPSDLDAVMPTTLGNVLRNAELYPRYRYGLDAVLVWPRLYLVASDRALAGVASARSDMDLHVTVCTLSVLYGTVAGTDALLTGRSWWAFILFFTVPMVVAWLSYQAAVAAARVYGGLVKAVFDVHRGDVLEKLAAEVTGPEPDRWYRLQQLWYRAVPIEASVAPEPPGEGAPDEQKEAPGWWARVPLSGWFALAVVGVAVLAALLSR